MELSLFKGFTDTLPESITLDALVAMMRTDESVRDYTEKHRYYRDMGNVSSAKYYKNRMPCFGVAARFAGGKRKEHITTLTGLSLVDIDHIAPDKMAEVLEKVRADEHTLLAYTTLSGQGIRVIARYETYPNPPCEGGDSNIVNSNSLPHRADARGASVATTAGLSAPRSLACEIGGGSLYKLAFLTINEYYAHLTGLATDLQCKNVGRLSTIAHDAALHYNPEAVLFVIKEEEKKPVGRPRKVQSGKMKDESGKMTMERCERLVQRELERRGIVYEAGTYNKYVSAFCYEMNRYGVPEEECREWAVNRFDDYNTPEVEAIVRSCYLQTEEHGTMRPHREAKDSYASVRDIQDWLTERGVQIRHNLITRKMEIRLNSNEDEDENENLSSAMSSHPDGNNSQFSTFNSQFIDLTDRHVNSLYRAFSLDTGRRLRISDLYIIIESDFYPEYHPLRQYLQSLPAWDGTDYIDALASRVHVIGCSQEMHNRYFKKWIVAMVATWLVDDVTNHEILTYIGPQGIYKSTFMRQLLPPELRSYFSARNFAHRMGKDDRLELTEMGLIALEELDHMKDYERPFPYEGIYAQAYALWQEHFPYWLNEAENAELEQHNRHFEEPNIEEELILTYLRKPYGDEVGEFLTATRIIELVGAYIKTKLSPRHVTMTMKRLGFEQRRTMKARGWNVIVLTGDDIKNNQRQDAHQSQVV